MHDVMLSHSDQRKQSRLDVPGNVPAPLAPHKAVKRLCVDSVEVFLDYQWRTVSVWSSTIVYPQITRYCRWSDFWYGALERRRRMTLWGPQSIPLRWNFMFYDGTLSAHNSLNIGPTERIWLVKFSIFDANSTRIATRFEFTKKWPKSNCPKSPNLYLDHDLLQYIESYSESVTTACRAYHQWSISSTFWLWIWILSLVHFSYVLWDHSRVRTLLVTRFLANSAKVTRKQW